MSALAVVVGGALGALLRYALTFASFLQGKDDAGKIVRFPWPTFVANVLASFVLGAVIRIVGSGTTATSETIVTFFAVGLCGALSTMSTFALELFNLMRQRATVTAVGYLTLSLGAAMAAMWLGLLVAS